MLFPSVLEQAVPNIGYHILAGAIFTAGIIFLAWKYPFILGLDRREPTEFVVIPESGKEDIP